MCALFCGPFIHQKCFMNVYLCFFPGNIDCHYYKASSIANQHLFVVCWQSRLLVEEESAAHISSADILNVKLRRIRKSPLYASPPWTPSPSKSQSSPHLWGAGGEAHEDDGDDDDAPDGCAKMRGSVKHIRCALSHYHWKVKRCALAVGGMRHLPPHLPHTSHHTSHHTSPYLSWGLVFFVDW